MGEGKFARAEVKIFKGMDQGTAATKLAEGFFVVDENGRHNQIGSWGQRLGVVRVGGGVAQAASADKIYAVHQFLPLGSGSQNFASQYENGAVRLSNLILIASGVAEGFANPEPQA